MDRFKKKIEIIVLLVLIILVSFTIIILITKQFSYDFNKDQINKNEFNIVNKKSPKLAGDLEFNSLIIDDWGSGNLTWKEAKDQPWCNGSGTYNDPYVIENITFNPENSGSCLIIRNSTTYFIIRNCTFINSGSDFDAGIKLENVTNGQLINNNCSVNYMGIYLASSNNIKIYENCLQNNANGICIDLSSFNNTLSGNNVINHTETGIFLCLSYNNTIKDNYIDNREFPGKSSGISLYSSYNNIISGNEIVNNNLGIYLWVNSNNNTISRNIVNNNSMHGISLFLSDNNTILQNKIINNKEHGIDLQNFCKNNTITGNLIANNTKIGATFDSNTANNTIYKNAFIGNLLLHAQDDGIKNRWDNGTIGNYWDDYLDLGSGAVDTDGDNIGDMNYTVSGIAKANDTRPIWKLKIFISIIWPAPNYVFGYIAPNFNIKVEHIVEAITIDTMWYTIDGGITNYTFTKNGQINQIAYNNLPNGPIRVIFFANDSLGTVGLKEILITKSAIYRGSIVINLNMKAPTERGSENETGDYLTIFFLGLTIGSICAISTTSIYYYETKVKVSKSIQPFKKKKYGKKIFPVLSSKEILENLINKTLLLQIFDDLQPKQEISRFEKVKLSIISEEFLDKIDKIDFKEKDKIEFIRELLCLSPKERQEIIDNVLNRIKSETLPVLSSKTILENMVNKELIIQNFDKEKFINKLSLLKKIRLTLTTEEFLNKVDKIEFEENDKIEFIREMLCLSPKERQDVIDNMLNRLNSDDLKNET